MKRKKVALLYDSVLDVGGVESHLLSILNGGYSNDFSFFLYSQVSERFLAKVEPGNAKIIQPKRRHLINPITAFETVKYLRSEGIDLVHAHSPSASLWGRIAARIVNIPALVTVHLPVDQYHGTLETFRAKLGRVIYMYLDRWLNHHPRYTNKMIYVSQSVYDREIKNGQSASTNSTVILNGIDLEVYDQVAKAEARKHFDLPPNTKIISFVGRLDEQKGVDVLIDAIAIMKRNAPDFEVWVLGDGPLRKTVEDQVRNLNLERIVKLLGYQENIPLYLMAGDIFVLPSRYEGMSIALLHGLAAGLPCVVSQVGENDSLVNDGVNGLVVPPEGIERLAKALETLLSDDDLCERMSVAAKSKANDFTEEKMIKQLELVYNECAQI